MNRPHTIRMGGRGRLVVPVEVRRRAGLVEGTSLVLLESPSELVLLTREQLRQRVRDELTGLDLVDRLILERRAAAAQHDVE